MCYDFIICTILYRLSGDVIMTQVVLHSHTWLHSFLFPYNYVKKVLSYYFLILNCITNVIVNITTSMLYSF